MLHIIQILVNPVKNHKYLTVLFSSPQLRHGYGQYGHVSRPVRRHGPPLPLQSVRRSPPPPPPRQGADGQTSVLLHRTHHHGNTRGARQESHTQRHLSVHHGPVPFL